MEGVEGCEVRVEGAGRGGEGFACGVHLDGEEGEGFVHCEKRLVGLEELLGGAEVALRRDVTLWGERVLSVT